MMGRLILWSRDHPCWVIGLLLVGSLAAITQLHRLHVDTSLDGLMDPGDPQRAFCDETRERFGSDNITFIFVRDVHLFTPEKLSHLEQLVLELEDLPHVQKVQSLYTLSNIRNRDGMLDVGPLLEAPPATVEQAEQHLSDALRNPIYRNNLVSLDGTVTGLNVYLEEGADAADFNEQMNGRLQFVLGRYADHFDELFQFGEPYDVSVQKRWIQKDQKVLFPLAALVVMLMSVVLLRSSTAAVLPLLTSAFSILWTLGFMGVAGLPITVISFTVPALIAVVGSTEDMHILSKYMDRIEAPGASRPTAIEYMAGKIGTALLLTSLTTFLGFLAISLNRIENLRSFGFTAGFGLFINPLMTVMIAPVFLRWFGKRPAPRRRRRPHIMDRWLRRLARTLGGLTTKRGGWVAAAFAAVMASSLLLAPRIRSDGSLPGFFEPDSEILQRVRAIGEHLAGVGCLSIRIDAPAAGDFHRADTLQRVDALQMRIAQDEFFDKTVSLTDFIKLAHREVNDGRPEQLTIPDSDRSIAEYMLFLHRDDIDRYVNTSGDSLRIDVRHALCSTEEFNVAVARLESTIRDTIPSGFTARVTGRSLLVHSAVSTIARAQFYGLGFVLVVVFLLITLLFGDIRVGLLSLIPNVFPVAVLLGVMGALDIPLNTGTCMVAVIALGIAVDDTIHFLARYRESARRCASPAHAIHACLYAEIRPIMCTSLSLSAGFAVIGLSHFLPIQQFGRLSAVVMLAALLADLLLTPVLLQRLSFSRLAK